MSKNEDTVLDGMDFDYEDTSDKELKELLKNTLVSLVGLNESVGKLMEIVSSQYQVNKNVGRKGCKMFYNNKEISNEDLKKLRAKMSVAEILRDFTYINEYSELITPYLDDESKIRCRAMITNRLRWGK